MAPLQIVPSNCFLIPEGPAGTRETLKAMRDQVQVDKPNSWVRDFAQSIVRQVPGKDWEGEIYTVFNWVQTNIRYSLDTNNLEVIQAPHVTLMLGYGDCDDFVCLLCGLLESLGHQTYICALGFDATESYSHVVALCAGAGGETGLIALDATEPMPAGWFPPGVTHAMIAPIS
jgi:transglutaminase-like putative cysteine protease